MFRQLREIPVERKLTLCLLLVVALGVALRFYGLAYQSLWLDELASWKQGNRATLAEVFKAVRVSVHPPGHNVLLYYLIRYIGDSETILRLPSAVGGVLAILAVYQIGRLLYTQKEGVVAAALVAVAWCPLYYSQEARAYGLLLGATTWATYFWLLIVGRLWRAEPMGAAAVLGYVVTAIGAAYLHYFGLYLIALQALASGLFFLRRGRMLLKAILLYIPIGLAYLPWLPAMLFQLGRGSSWVGQPGQGALLGYFLFLFNRSRWLLGLAAVLVTAWLLQTVWAWARHRPNSRDIRWPLPPAVLLWLWLLVPIAGIYLKSLTSAPVLTNRNLIISLPAAYLLLACALTQLPRRLAWQILLSSGMVVVFLLHLIFVLHYYEQPQKAQFREVVAYVVERDSLYPDALIIGHKVGWYNYYFEKLGSSRRVDVVGGRQRDVETVARVLAERRPPYVWLISAVATPPDKPFMVWLEESYTFVEHQDFFRGNVWLWQRK